MWLSFWRFPLFLFSAFAFAAVSMFFLFFSLLFPHILYPRKMSSRGICGKIPPAIDWRRRYPANLLLILVLILAHLICNATGRLAGRLARSLAFPTAAGLYALRQIAGFNCLDPFHIKSLLSRPDNLIIIQSISVPVNYFYWLSDVFPKPAFVAARPEPESGKGSPPRNLRSDRHIKCRLSP